jgi:hypothetical protein
MRSVLKLFQTDPCRTHDISANDYETFSNYTHLQRYNPALDMFTIPDSVLSHKNLELPSKYQIDSWISQDKPKFWKATRIVTNSSNEESKSEPCDVFTKIIHLLNPIDMIKEKYVCPEHPLLPQSEKTWKSTLLKLHSHNNQAYVDATANFILSRFRELDLTPHCVLFYGSFTGISKSYQYNITNEYDTYRQCRWFWKGMESHSAKIVIQHDIDSEDIPNYEDIYKEITTCPFDDDEELEQLDKSVEQVDNTDVESVKSFTFDNIEEEVENSKNIFEINKNITNSSLKKSHADKNKNESEIDNDSGSDDGSDGSDGSYDGSYDGSDNGSNGSNDSDETVQLDLDICLEIPNMPIIIIKQEAHEGIMDSLIDEDEIDGHERNSQGWELRWIAWLFQVIAALTFLQSAICFTHNDLHSNNILWRATDKKYLYYKIKDGSVWRIPTYGKIFSIIDFGRAIFRLGNHLWVSDDHWPDQDASDQYNFGPFFDHNKPKNVPNPSFDLCRLAVSLIDGLFDDPPSKKKGKNIPIMSQDDSWKVYETKSQLYNLLWSWTVDNTGRTIYEDKDGNERYDGFDLYIRIAHDVHNAIPREQLHRPVFQQFIWKNKVSQDDKIYSLGI